MASNLIPLAGAVSASSDALRAEWERPLSQRALQDQLTSQTFKARHSIQDRDPSRVTRYSTRAYSVHGRPPTQKMQVQLDAALRQGLVDNPNTLSSSYSYEGVTQTINTPSVGGAQSQGPRRYMEDLHFSVELTLPTNPSMQATLLVVCDGHCDSLHAGKYVENHLPNMLQQRLTDLSDDRVTRVLTECMLDLDSEIHEHLKVEHDLHIAGTTCTAALILPDRVYMINVGDSFGLLCKPGAVYKVTEDAVVGNKNSAERFKSYKKEGHILKQTSGFYYIYEQEGSSRGFSLARDLGSFLSPRPKITCLKRADQPDNLADMAVYAPKGSYLILCSDGIVASNESIYAVVNEMQAMGVSPCEIACSLVGRALVSSCDNITALVIAL
ncbi:MAG: hypothetical protein S4CHLAM2_17490 [Chlamydiales bacterium]|nr:hypothetical protein [Chlamydiales bacterium]